MVKHSDSVALQLSGLSESEVVSQFRSLVSDLSVKMLEKGMTSMEFDITGCDDMGVNLNVRASREYTPEEKAIAERNQIMRETQEKQQKHAFLARDLVDLKNILHRKQVKILDRLNPLKELLTQHPERGYAKNIKTLEVNLEAVNHLMSEANALQEELNNTLEVSAVMSDRWSFLYRENMEILVK